MPTTTPATADSARRLEKIAQTSWAAALTDSASTSESITLLPTILRTARRTIPIRMRLSASARIVSRRRPRAR